MPPNAVGSAHPENYSDQCSNPVYLADLLRLQSLQALRPERRDSGEAIADLKWDTQIFSFSGLFCMQRTVLGGRVHRQRRHSLRAF